MIGTTLQDRYLLKEKLSSGGFGETYLAESPQKLSVPQRKCVVKLLKPNRKDDSDIVSRFKHEAEILITLGKEHDQIPKYIDYFEENQDFYIVQEYIEGHDLSNEITVGKPWSEDEVIELLQGVLKVLAYVHEQGVIHRDIKPSNIMRRYSDHKLILIDFGAVKEVIPGIENISSTIEIGTMAYMPSEQRQGYPQFASDIYAVGLMAIQALTGLAVGEIRKDNKLEFILPDQINVSQWLADILAKMVQYDFRHRYRDATEVLNALKQTTAELEPLDNLPVPFQESGKWGYETRTGEVVIQAQFNSAQKFSEGLARVGLGDQVGYIDQTGKIVIQPNYLWGGKFCEGLARVRNVKKTYGYINKQGNPINKKFLDGALDFCEGVAPVMINNKWGYMNQNGEIVIEPQFDEAEKFDNGLARVRNGWQSHTIDKAGNLIH